MNEGEELSNVDAIRRLFQDLLAPEVKSIVTRLDGLEKLTEERFKRLDEKIDANRRELDAKIDANHREIMAALNVERRIALIEDRQQREAAHG